MYLVFWGAPTIAVVASAFASVPYRTAVWTVALLWMGAACLANARRCGRTHCRYTGPFYLLMIMPVLLHGLGAVSFGHYAWYVLGGIILAGGKLIWWLTETAWGRYPERGRQP
jgi:hypothetical protein